MDDNPLEHAQGQPEIVVSPPTDVTLPAYIVGVGASAGGLQALESFFSSMPSDTGLSFVVIQHLSPTFKSLMDELLARITEIPIDVIEDGSQPRPNTIHLMPAGTEVILTKGAFKLTTRNDTLKPIPRPIDRFFASLAQEVRDRAIGIILSGTGSDGSQGLIKIHEAGGFVLVQAPEDTQFDGMPSSAIQTGLTDFILPAEQMALTLVAYKLDPLSKRKLSGKQLGSLTPMDVIFRLLWDRYDIDFSQYKTTTMTRRIERRLSLSGDASLLSYIDRLSKHEAALDQLYRDLLIGVTHFFRDPDAFTYIQQEILPQLIRATTTTRALRVWVAGCATGEEAYSLAIVIHETILALNAPISIQLFATDVHQASLDTASHGVYSPEAMKHVSPKLRARYFTETPEGYRVTPTLRQMVMFARHDLTRDMPFGNIDLITCRNVLIYFQSESQEQTLRHFLYGLREQGILFLGPSESVGTFDQALTELDRRWKIYRKDGDIEHAISAAPTPRPTPKAGDKTALRHLGLASKRMSAAREQLYDALLETMVPAGILVNAEGRWEHIVGDISMFLRPFSGPNNDDVIDLVHEELRSPLQAAIIHASNERKVVTYHNLPLSILPQSPRVTLKVSPLTGLPSLPPALFISFAMTPDESIEQATTAVVADDAVSNAPEWLTYELAQTKAVLQSTIEELHTRTEELQTTNEELIASNEELQSSNEELQSVNEELHTINSEYQNKNQQLSELHTDTENLLRSIDIGTVFLDTQGAIRKYTPSITTAIPLRPQDVGRPLNHFTTLLDTSGDVLSELLKRVLEDQVPQTHEVRTQTGRQLLMRLHPFLTETQDIEGTVVTFVDITEQNEMQVQLQHSNAARNQFVHVASHDLKAPLRAIQNLTGWLAEDVEDILPEASQHDLRLIHQRALKMEELLETLLQYSKIRDVNLQPEQIDSGVLIKELLLLLDLPSGVSIEVAPEMPILIVPRPPLELVLRNLLSYAVKHRVPSTSQLSVSGHVQNQSVKFTIAEGLFDRSLMESNNGFQPANTSQLETDDDGSHLNMVFVMNTVQEHGGQLRIGPTQNQGRAYQFSWPQAINAEEA